MSTTDELLEEMLEDAEEYATPVTDDDLQFWIDEHLRVISIPKNGVVAGVEGDKNVNKIKFGMNRYYHDFDMSTFSGRILYSNAKGNKNYYNITDMQASGNTITFSWLVDADAVQYMGKTAFVVYLFKTHGSELRQKFYSTLNTLNVLEGMEVDSAVPVEKQTDIIERMKEEISAYAEEVKKSLPADYTAMTEQVSSLKEDIDERFNKFQVKSKYDDRSEMFMIKSTNDFIGWSHTEKYSGYTWSSATERIAKDKYTCTGWFALPEGIYKIPKVWTSDPYGNQSAIIHAKMRENGLYITQMQGDLFFAQSECLYAVTLPTETFNKYTIISNYNFDATPIVIDIPDLIEKKLVVQSGTRWRIDITESIPQDEIKNLAYMYFVGFPDYEFASDESWNKRVYPSGINDGNSIAYSHICLYKSGSTTVIDINGISDEKWFFDRESKIILGR
jgi:hypothetical protein